MPGAKDGLFSRHVGGALLAVGGGSWVVTVYLHYKDAGWRLTETGALRGI